RSLSPRPLTLVRRGSVTRGREKFPGVLSAARSEHLFGCLARLPIHAGLGRPGELVDAREPEYLSRSAPPASSDLALGAAPSQVGMRPGTSLCFGHALGHRGDYRGTTSLVILALGDLVDEASCGRWLCRDPLAHVADRHGESIRSRR